MFIFIADIICIQQGYWPIVLFSWAAFFWLWSDYNTDLVGLKLSASSSSFGNVYEGFLLVV
jgi:hypothetical protein